MTSSPREHWLVGVARQRGLINGQTPSVDPGTPVAPAWASVCDACAIAPEALADEVAKHFAFPKAHLERVEPRVLTLVPEAAARRYGIVPLREDDRYIVIATANPLDVDMEQAIGFLSGRRVQLEIASPGALASVLDQHYSPDRAVAALLGNVDSATAATVHVVEELAPEAIALHELGAAPVVKLTNLIIQNAIAERASDIHIEPGRVGGGVRIRVDGVLRQQMQLPMAALNRVVSRIKILGKMDIADRLRPQDGRARVQVRGKTYDLRLSTVPTREAEKAVIRILDPEATPQLEQLGIAAPELERFRHLLAYREGIVVVTGPTGSGKTTTLYAAIKELATRSVNIMTVEDPVEYELPGVTQIQVEPKRGVTFASALRAILRQDPNVIFIGEIRDLETAEIAVQASMTGHLVLATLHTNEAIAIVPRLVDLGLSRVSIAGSLRGVVAQRLVRRVCRHCHGKIAGAMTEEERALSARYGVVPVVRAVGCKQCAGTGYSGRLSVCEVLASTPELADVIAKSAVPSDLHRAAEAGGMRPMRNVAREIVGAGVTTLTEIERVLGEQLEESATHAVPAPLRVAVVDDDAALRTMARALLEKEGMVVDEFADGRAALEHLEAGAEPSLMVLDLNLPTMHGLDVLRRVRKTLRSAGLPVVVLTGSENSGDEVASMEAGADDYIRKPLDPPRFVARVKAALRRAGPTHSGVDLG
jgi:type IV pilus assembly protein PilB